MLRDKWCDELAGDYALQRYATKIDSALKPASDQQTIGVYAQIRGQLPLISAVLGAPAYVSNLTDAEAALLRSNLEKAAPPEVIEERDFVVKALAEIERGWRAARARIAQRAGSMPNTNAA